MELLWNPVSQICPKWNPLLRGGVLLDRGAALPQHVRIACLNGGNCLDAGWGGGA